MKHRTAIARVRCRLWLPCTLALAALFCVGAQAIADQATEQLVIPLDLTSVAVARGKADTAVFQGAPLAGVAGQPALPRKTVKVLLPPDADLRTVVGALAEVKTETLAGTWDLEPMPPLATGTNILWPAHAKITDGRDTDAYARNSLRPISFIGRATTGQMREWCFAEVHITPFKYNPATRQLVRLTEAQLVVKFTRVSGRPVLRSKSSRSRSLYRAQIQQTVVNFDQVASEYENGAQTPGGER